MYPEQTFSYIYALSVQFTDNFIYIPCRKIIRTVNFISPVCTLNRPLVIYALSVHSTEHFIYIPCR